MDGHILNPSQITTGTPKFHLQVLHYSPKPFEDKLVLTVRGNLWSLFTS